MLEKETIYLITDMVGSYHYGIFGNLSLAQKICVKLLKKDVAKLRETYTLEYCKDNVDWQKDCIHLALTNYCIEEYELDVEDSGYTSYQLDFDLDYNLNPVAIKWIKYSVEGI